MKICICGGGHLGHVVAGFLAAQPDTRVRMLTFVHDLAHEKDIFCPMIDKVYELGIKSIRLQKALG